MNMIVQTKDVVKSGLQRRLIFGLNILRVNRVKVSTEDDPRVVLLRNLDAQHTCSAHTGNLHQLALSPQELFGTPGEDNVYLESRTGIYDGTFYDATGWPSFPACFFPRIESSFWGMKNAVGEGDVREALELGALAIYVAPADGALPTMASLQSEVFPGEEAWLRTAADLYNLIIVPTADCDYFSVYSKDASHFDCLAPALAEAVSVIEGGSWYQQHAASLLWDGEYNMCLMLPELMRQ